MALGRLPENQRLFRDNCKQFSAYLLVKCFLEFVVIGLPNECWIWKGGRSGRYGQFHINRKAIAAHIASYRLFVGRTHNKCVCHSCDTPKCVNPNHLWLGTHKDNIQDCNNKGRDYRGKRYGVNTGTKLTTKKVKKIRTLHVKGYSLYKLARKFNVTPANISAIVHYKTWKDS